MNSEKPTKGRAWHRKTRTGCRTCKTRKVKCDEIKPVCERCEVFGVDCEGYDTNPLTRKRWASTALPLLMPTIPHTASFRNQNEYQYFNYFRDNLSAQLSGPFSQNFFKHIILRACNDEPPLRDLIISIAALTESKKTSGFSASHHQFAARQYGKALHGIQQVISTRHDVDATRVSLIASLLIFCFENIHGQEEVAITNIKSAMKLMHKCLSATSRQYSSIRTNSPLPNLEGELFNLFVKLDSMLVSRIDPTGPMDTSLLGLAYVDDICPVPALFANIFEARDYFEQIHYLGVPYLSHLMHVLSTGRLDPTRMPASVDTYDRLSAQLHQWSLSFASLLTHAYTAAGRHEFVPAAMLHLQSLATQLCLNRIYHAVTSITNDIPIVDSEEILELCRAVAADPSFKKVFVFDCGIIPVLFTIFLIFKEKSIKEEAIRILRIVQPRRELTWDAKIVADIAESLLGTKV